MDLATLFTQNNLVIQRETYTCAACSLLNVLRLKGNMSYDELELAEMCGAKPGIGTSHEDLVRTARGIGLEVLEEKREASLSDVEQYTKLGIPVIINYIHVYSGNGHYAVLTGMDERSVYLRDGTLGFLRLERQEFETIWCSGDNIPQGFVALK